MRVLFKATTRFFDDVRRDLARSHRFALERVGFISTRAANTTDALIVIAQAYHPVGDADYLNDDSVGAMMGQEAIRKALNLALLQPLGMFHVHMHAHEGCPTFSRTDLREQTKFVPDFFKVRQEMPHGAIVLSNDRAVGRAWLGPSEATAISEFVMVGPKTNIDQGGSGRIDFIA